jgi:hypothetical protein
LQQNIHDNEDINEFEFLGENLDLSSLEKRASKNNNSNSISIKLLNFLNNFSYFKQSFGHSKEKSQISKLSSKEGRKDSLLNSNVFFLGNTEKKTDRLLHIKNSSVNLKFTTIFDKMYIFNYLLAEQKTPTLSKKFQ